MFVAEFEILIIADSVLKYSDVTALGGGEIWLVLYQELPEIKWGHVICILMISTSVFEYGLCSVWSSACHIARSTYFRKHFIYTMRLENMNCGVKLLGTTISV